MGIQNIHILTDPEKDNLALKAQAALEAQLIAEHRRGEHPVGAMRRACPLCNGR